MLATPVPVPPLAGLLLPVPALAGLLLPAPGLPGARDGAGDGLAADGTRSRPLPRVPPAGTRGARADAASASSAWTRSPGCGREISLARMAADSVIFIAMAASPVSVARLASALLAGARLAAAAAPVVTSAAAP